MQVVRVSHSNISNKDSYVTNTQTIQRIGIRNTDLVLHIINIIAQYALTGGHTTLAVENRERTSQLSVGFAELARQPLTCETEANFS